MRMPPDVDPAMDRRLMRETGRRLADGYLKDPPLSASNVTREPAVGDGFTRRRGAGDESGVRHELPRRALATCGKRADE